MVLHQQLYQVLQQVHIHLRLVRLLQKHIQYQHLVMLIVLLRQVIEQEVRLLPLMPVLLQLSVVLKLSVMVLLRVISVLL